MPLESLHYEFCEKSYVRFTKTMHDKLELCTVLFKLNFRSHVVVFVFCTMNESFAGLPKLFTLGFYIPL